MAARDHHRSGKALSSFAAALAHDQTCESSQASLCRVLLMATVVRNHPSPTLRCTAVHLQRSSLVSCQHRPWPATVGSLRMLKRYYVHQRQCSPLPKIFIHYPETVLDLHRANDHRSPLLACPRPSSPYTSRASNRTSVHRQATATHKQGCLYTVVPPPTASC